MRADYLTYRRATSESVRGLLLQAVLAIGVLIYAIVGSDDAAMSAAAFIGIGVLGWLTLAVVYDQHRRERIEAIENEALATAPTAGTSVFEKQDEFLPAARRLAGLYKFFVPIMSIVIGSLLVGIGLWRFMVNKDGLGELGTAAVGRAGWGLGVGGLAAVIGFTFARYTAGLAKMPAFSNLRAGSSFAVGAALLGLTLAIGKFVHMLGPDVVVKYLRVVFPAFMVVIGVEVFVNFVLGVYRPRRAGETPRPAFDSRLLSFVAAPDKIAQSINEAINYQLGFDVTGGWFYKLLSKWALPLLVFGLLIVWGLTSVVIVKPHQRAMVLRFGKPVSTQDLGPGAHFKMPWPIDSVYVPEYYSKDEKGRSKVTDRTATGIRVLDLGTSPPAINDAILWTNDHAGDEVYQFVRASAYDQGGAQQELADLAIVSVEIPMHYTVSDVRLFDELAPPDKRDDVLKAVARRELTYYFQRVLLDEVLGGKREQMSRDLKKRIQQAYDNLNPDPATGKARGAGVQIVFLGIAGVHPPKEVAAAFEGPVMADQRAEANIEDARAYAIMKLADIVGNVTLARSIIAEIDAFERMNQAKADPKALEEQELKVQGLIESAGGGAAIALAQARADRWQAHMGMKGRAARHQGQVALYTAAPAYYKASRYFDSLKVAMANARVYITSEEIRDLRTDIDLKDKTVGVDVFSEKED
ncbi:MAG TPA: SPFH domain-containing protein [Phycisphaerales bacterium]|nr:SPFH domain-containing protein [Phycisphaerales bacterium]